MALLDVSGYKYNSPSQFGFKQTHLLDRNNHYSFGSKCQEFAVPVGVDVSNFIIKVNESLDPKEKVSDSYDKITFCEKMEEAENCNQTG